MSASHYLLLKMLAYNIALGEVRFCIIKRNLQQLPWRLVSINNMITWSLFCLFDLLVTLIIFELSKFAWCWWSSYNSQFLNASTKLGDYFYSRSEDLSNQTSYIDYIVGSNQNKRQVLTWYFKVCFLHFHYGNKKLQKKVG